MSEVAVEVSTRTILSRIVRLRLAYDVAAADAPATMVLKTSVPEREGLDWEGGRDEVAFYQQIASAVPGQFTARCFDAQWDAQSNKWHLLLEDLKESHYIATTWPIPPSMAQCTAIIEAKARFQALWWDDARLGVSIGKWTEAAAAEAMLERFTKRFAQFTERLGDGLTAERRTLYERLIEAGPRLKSRYQSHRNITIVQGDAHVWNCFLPREASGGVRFFDWDCWRIDTATDDLAYMMAVHWYPDLRARFERPLLDRYHEALVAGGVQGYDRRALEDDYRLSVLWQIMTPVWQAGIDIPAGIWWNNYERIMMAVDDLDCRELLR